MVPLWTIPNALATGNTYILKPSEKDPSAPMFIAELAPGGRLPAGRSQRCSTATKWPSTDCSITQTCKALSFVGSTPIAKYVYETGTAHGKRVQALGGAKNHMVVLPDADLKLRCRRRGLRRLRLGRRTLHGHLGLLPPLAMWLIHWSMTFEPAWRNCASASVPILIQRWVRSSREEHRDRVAGYVGIGADEGASAGRRWARPGQFAGDGYFLGTSLLDHVTTDMSVYQDEIFRARAVRGPRATPTAMASNSSQDNPVG